MSELEDELNKRIALLENALKFERLQLEAARQELQSWAWLGFNGSPFPDEPRRELQTRYQNHFWAAYRKIFLREP